MGAWANDILNVGLPAVARQALFADKHNLSALNAHCVGVEDQEALRASLGEKGLVAFVKNGSLLPRLSGAQDLPMEGDEVVPFQSPASLEITLPLQSGGTVVGMGVKRGTQVEYGIILVYVFFWIINILPGLQSCTRLMINSNIYLCLLMCT